MKNQIIQVIVLITLFSCTAFSQSYNSLFARGEAAFQQKNYSLAVESYSHAILANDTRNARFNRGLSYYHLKETEKFCLDMEKAKQMYDKQANKLFNKYCCDVSVIENNISSVTLKVKSRYSEFTEYLEILKVSRDTVIYQVIDSQRVYSVLPIKPVYKGKYSSFYEFVAKEIYYPDEAKISGIQGMVYIEIIIDSEGNIVSKKVIESVHKSLNKAAMDVVDKIEKFKPAMLYDSTPVAFRFEFPFSFYLR